LSAPVKVLLSATAQRWARLDFSPAQLPAKADVPFAVQSPATAEALVWWEELVLLEALLLLEVSLAEVPAQLQSEFAALVELLPHRVFQSKQQPKRKTQWQQSCLPLSS
jgi:hypothetical protein